MAKSKKKDNDLFDTLRARGLRKKVARTVADVTGNGKRTSGRGEKVARQVLADLNKAADEVRGRLPGGATARSEAGRKAALTRKRNAAKRSASARKGAATRAKAKPKR